MPKSTVELRGAVAELVVDAPPLNLFAAAMIGDIEAAVDRIRGHVIAGEAPHRAVFERR